MPTWNSQSFQTSAPLFVGFAVFPLLMGWVCNIWTFLSLKGRSSRFRGAYPPMSGFFVALDMNNIFRLMDIMGEEVKNYLTVDWRICVRPPRKQRVLFSCNQYDTSYNDVHLSFTIYFYHFRTTLSQSKLDILKYKWQTMIKACCYHFKKDFHGAYATGVASHQGTLTLPDTWFRPPFGTC